MNIQIATAGFCATPIQKVVATIAAPDSTSSVTFRKLISAAPPPSDYLGLQLAIDGAAAAIIDLIQLFTRTRNVRTDSLIKIRDEFQALHVTCQEQFAEGSLADPITLAKRRLSPNPAWRLLILAGLDRSSDPARTVSAGILLVRALLTEKPMPTALCKALCTTDMGYPHDAFLPYLLQPAQDIEEPTLRRLSGNLMELLALLGDGELQPFEKTIHQIARDSWTSRAAFSSVNARSAVSDSRCLSSSQMTALSAVKSIAPFSSLPEKKAAIFFGLCTGLAPEHLASIPFDTDTKWSEEIANIWIDVRAGVLVKNYQVLCVDASSLDFASSAARYRFNQPLPTCIHKTLTRLLAARPNARTLGELIPELKTVSTRSALYPSTAGLLTTWAKLRFSGAPFLRQNGIAALLAATNTADIATMLKSKFYYCRIPFREVIDAADRAYKLLGFEQCSTAENLADFGSSATSPDDLLLQIDQLLLAKVKANQPANNCSVAKLISHHNALTVWVGFRVSLACALRESKVLPILSGHANQFATISVAEKSPHHITGNLEALVPESIRRLLSEYKVHCKKLALRLRKNHVDSDFTAHLERLHNDDDAPLLTLSGKEGKVKYLGTANILQAAGFLEIAPDFGRKWSENALRQAGMRSTDIDRILRHEGLGQDSLSYAADGCFDSWINRAGRILEKALETVLVTRLTKGGKA